MFIKFGCKKDLETSDIPLARFNETFSTADEEFLEIRIFEYLENILFSCNELNCHKVEINTHIHTHKNNNMDEFEMNINVNVDLPLDH